VVFPLPLQEETLWMVLQGIITSGLNHAVHDVVAEVKEGNARAEVRKMNEEYRASGGVLPQGQELEGYDTEYYDFGGDEANAKAYFKFASDNSKYEFGMSNLTSNVTGQSSSYVSTSFKEGGIHMYLPHKTGNYTNRLNYSIHSHPGGNWEASFASGQTPMQIEEYGLTNHGDMNEISPYKNANHYIYDVGKKSIFQYNYYTPKINQPNLYNTFFK
jgi:hypothetical protein